MPKPTPTVSDEDIRRKYYEAAGYSMWITEMQLDPLQLVVCDDATGKHFRVPVALSGGEFTFSDPVEVMVQYVDSVKARAASAIVWASRGDSLAGMPPAPPDPPTPARPVETPAQAAARIHAAAVRAGTETPDASPAAGPTSTEGAPSMGAAETILEALGLSPDATREQVTAALSALRAGPAGPADSPPAELGAATPVEGKSLADLAKMAQDTGVVLIDKSQLAEMVSMAKQGADAAKRMRENERDDVIEKACKDGKIALSRVAHWQTAWDKDSEGTRDALASLAPNMIPVEMSGYAGRGDFALSEADAAYVGLFGKEG